VFQFDLRIAWRGLRRSPGFTFVVVTTMALGLGANLALFAMLSELLWKPLPFSDPDRIASLFGVRPDKSERSENYGLGSDGTGGELGLLAPASGQNAA